MDNIKLTFFDLFGHVLPGTVLLLALILPFNNCIYNFTDLYKIIIGTNIYFTLFYLLVSFIISSVFHSIGYRWFESIGKKIYKGESRAGGEEKLKGHDYSMLNVYIREFSQANSIAIEEWIAKKAMCFNLSISFMALSVSITIKIIVIKFTQTKVMPIHDLSIAFIATLIFSFLILNKARGYHDWYHDEIYSSIKLIGNKNNITILNTSLFPPATNPTSDSLSA